LKKHSVDIPGYYPDRKAQNYPSVMLRFENFTMRGHWEEEAEKYTSQRQISPVDERVTEIVSTFGKGRVLEIGPGAGIVAEGLLRRLPTLDYIALDISQRFLQITRARIREGARYIQGDALNLPFQDESIDIVFEMDAIHHFPRGIIPAVVNEIARSIKVGGWLLLAEDWANPPADEKEKIARFLQKNRKLDKSNLEYHPSEQEWMAMVEASGMEIVEREYVERPMNLKKMVEDETSEILEKAERLKELWGENTPQTKMLLILSRKR
jgi:ubiquinone/menaquinone biosynthesis C-methylase UbiE